MCQIAPGDSRVAQPGDTSVKRAFAVVEPTFGDKHENAAFTHRPTYVGGWASICWAGFRVHSLARQKLHDQPVEMGLLRRWNRGHRASAHHHLTALMSA